MSEAVKERILAEKSYLNDYFLKSELGHNSWASKTIISHSKSSIDLQKHETFTKILSYVSSIRKQRAELVKSANNYSAFFYSHSDFDRPIVIKLASKTFELPYELTYLVPSLKHTIYILDLKDNWDDSGAIAIPLQVYFNTIEFILLHAEFIFEEYNSFLAMPIVSPCSDGSIDVLWKNGKGRILFNFKNSPDNSVHFYGDDFTENSQFKGSFISKTAVEYLASYLKMFSNINE